jgi:hypothetical protein
MLSIPNESSVENRFLAVANIIRDDGSILFATDRRPHNSPHALSNPHEAQAVLVGSRREKAREG